jgi:Xaa-Pro dipeptidase
MTATGGTLVMEDGAGIDFAALRAARRQRVLDRMAADGVDLLLVGRSANVRYVVGHRPIWRGVLTGWAPFAALQADGTIHLLHSTWDDGVPPEVDHQHITGLSWNPRRIVEDILGTGIPAASCLAVDGMTPNMAMLFAGVAPDARLVDGEALLRDARAVKLPAEVECVRTAVAVTEGALAAAGASITPDTTGRVLKGRFHEAMGRYGLSHPAWEGSFGPEGDLEATIADGDAVWLAGALSFGGYEAPVLRTLACGDEPLATDALEHALSAVVDGCRPGAGTDDLRAAWAATGEDLPWAFPLVQGTGLGVDAPIVGGCAGPTTPDEPLLEGMVLTVTAQVGPLVSSETVHVTDDGPERLTRLRHT